MYNSSLKFYIILEDSDLEKLAYTKNDWFKCSINGERLVTLVLE